MTEKIPIEYVRGTDEVTVWLWPSHPDPVTVRLATRQWAKLEQQARDHAEGDMEKLITRLLEKDVMEAQLVGEAASN